MKKGKRIVFLGVGLLLLILSLAERARADEISELKQLLDEQTQMLREMQERLSQLEASQRLKEQSLTEKIEELAEKKQAPAPNGMKINDSHCKRASRISDLGLFSRAYSLGLHLTARGSIRLERQGNLSRAIQFSRY